jgi:aspartate aminotransferase
MRLRRNGREVFNLGIGQSPFPIPAGVVEALRLNAKEKKYLPVKGLPELRSAVAGFHRRKDSINARADLVIIGPGSKELLFLLQLVFGGEIIISTPSWVSYAPQAKILDRKIHFLRTTFQQRWHVTSKQLSKFCQRNNIKNKPHILMLNYPGNPNGLTYSEPELKEIAAVARKYNVVILSDEIYAGLHHKGLHVSMAKLYPEGTVVSSGLSKWCGAGGWRLGTFTFPLKLRWIMEAMAVVASETYTSVSAPIQYAAVSAFRKDDLIERYLWHVRRILSVTGIQSAEILQKCGIRVHMPEGAFYLFIDFTPMKEKIVEMGIRTNTALVEKILKDTGVAILPGHAFNRASSEFTARIAYVNIDGAKVLTASESIPLDQRLPDNFTDVWCKNTITAIERIAEWTAKL